MRVIARRPRLSDRISPKKRRPGASSDLGGSRSPCHDSIVSSVPSGSLMSCHGLAPATASSQDSPPSTAASATSRTTSPPRRPHHRPPTIPPPHPPHPKPHPGRDGPP